MLKVLLFLAILILLGGVFFWKLEECFALLLMLKKKVIAVVFADINPPIHEIWEDMVLPKSNNWYSREMLIAHACGGNVRLAYTNSEEALRQAIQDGFRVIEVDLRLSNDGVALCAHDFPVGKDSISHSEFLQTKIDGRFTPMDFKRFWEIAGTAGLTIIVDIKAEEQVETIVRILENTVVEREHVYIQLRKESERNLTGDFPVLYNLGRTHDYRRTTAFCLTQGVHVVSIAATEIWADDGWRVLSDHGISVFAHTVNSISEYEALKKRGIQGVFTDFLLPQEVKIYDRERVEA